MDIGNGHHWVIQVFTTYTCPPSGPSVCVRCRQFWAQHPVQQGRPAQGCMCCPACAS